MSIEIHANTRGVPPLAAYAQLVRFALDKLLPESEEDGCCPRCCAACGALQLVLDADALDLMAAPVGDTYPEWWDVKRSKVDRDWLQRAWNGTACWKEHEPLP